MNGLALCAGVGGLELGLERVFPNFRTVAFVEGEAFAAANLVKKMEEGVLDQAPIWSDLRTFDGKPWRGKVDLISAGFPCQPFSLAGMRKGTEDERHLWPSVSRIIGEIQPSIIVLENVPGVLNAAGLGIFGNLSEMGYDVAWGIVRASEAGAPHRRARFFAVGVLSNPNIAGGRAGEGSKQSQRDLPRTPSLNLCSSLSNANNEGFQRGLSDGISNPERREKSEIRLPSQRGYRRTWDRSTPWAVEPGVGRVVDGVADWMDRLRATGNGVVPQQAELAIRILVNTILENQNPG